MVSGTGRQSVSSGAPLAESGAWFAGLRRSQLAEFMDLGSGGLNGGNGMLGSFPEFMDFSQVQLPFSGQSTQEVRRSILCRHHLLPMVTW